MSFIKNTHRKDPNLAEITELSQLLKLKNSVENENFKKYYRVICKVFDIIPEEVQRSVQFFNIKNN